ncbi:MAG TPA: hypothetical protein VIO16_09415, partial [Dehalococcoidia bacterium]
TFKKGARAGLLRCVVAFCAGFSDAGMPKPSTYSGAGVREAPRHEIAGCRAATGQRALWGFDRGVRPEKFGSKGSTRPRGVKGWAHVQE